MALSSKTLPPLPATPTLQSRIDALHADIEKHIDAIVAATAAACPGVPAVRIKHDLLVRAGFCQCASVSQNPEKVTS
jgi:hypothetical protein